MYHVIHSLVLRFLVWQEINTFLSCSQPLFSKSNISCLLPSVFPPPILLAVQAENCMQCTSRLSGKDWDCLETEIIMERRRVTLSKCTLHLTLCSQGCLSGAPLGASKHMIWNVDLFKGNLSWEKNVEPWCPTCSIGATWGLLRLSGPLQTVVYVFHT